MTNPQTPPGTRVLYMVATGQWPRRTDLRSVHSLKEGQDWIDAQPKQRPRGHYTVNRTVLTRLGANWHRVSVNPVDNRFIPKNWREPKVVEPPTAPPAPEPEQAPRKFSAKERLRILFTGLPE